MRAFPHGKRDGSLRFGSPSGFQPAWLTQCIYRESFLLGQLRLTLPFVAPPLPDVDVPSAKGVGLVVVCPLVHDRWVRRAVEHDEGELRQVDAMDLVEDILPQYRFGCRQLLFVEGI